MIRRAAIAAGFVLLLSAGSSGQWTVPQPECCPRIYDTGRWLGWATALLQHACEVGRYEPEQTIIDCLTNAGLNAAAAYSACSSGVPAWPDYTHKQLWLAGLATELRHPGNSTKYRETRWELVSSAISTTWVIAAIEPMNARKRMNDRSTSASEGPSQARAPSLIM